MSSNGEIIHLHVGQAGVQIANACWELYCLEHGISANGCVYDCPMDDSFRTFFGCSGTAKVVPRAIMVDSEPTVIDEVRTGSYCHLFKPETLISGKEDSGSNFARGYNTVGAELIDVTMNTIRCVAEACCGLKGFITFRSIGGGTGSGLGDRIMEELFDEYGKATKMDFIIFPSASMSPLIVEPYNSLLASHVGMEYSDCTFILDNEALYDICNIKLDVISPTYTNLNRIIGQAISGMTASQRFHGSTNVSFTEFQTNLVPFPRIHFPLVSYAPLVTMCNACFTDLSTEQLTHQTFQPASQLVRCNPADGKYMSCVLLYRGNVAPVDINTSIRQMKSKGAFEFVDWSPTGFKIGINSMPPCAVPGGDVGPTDRAVMALMNNTIIQRTWCRLLDKFTQLYERRAFIHHFTREGMEESTFMEASEDICSLIGDYREVEGQAGGGNTRESQYKYVKKPQEPVVSKKVTAPKQIPRIQPHVPKRPDRGAPRLNTSAPNLRASIRTSNAPSPPIARTPDLVTPNASNMSVSIAINSSLRTPNGSVSNLSAAKTSFREDLPMQLAIPARPSKMSVTSAPKSDKPQKTSNCELMSRIDCHFHIYSNCTPKANQCTGGAPEARNNPAGSAISVGAEEISNGVATITCTLDLVNATCCCTSNNCSANCVDGVQTTLAIKQGSPPEDDIDVISISSSESSNSSTSDGDTANRKKQASATSLVAPSRYVFSAPDTDADNEYPMPESNRKISSDGSQHLSSTESTGNPVEDAPPDVYRNSIVPRFKVEKLVLSPSSSDSDINVSRSSKISECGLMRQHIILRRKLNKMTRIPVRIKIVSPPPSTDADADDSAPVSGSGNKRKSKYKVRGSKSEKIPTKKVPKKRKASSLTRESRAASDSQSEPKRKSVSINEKRKSRISTQKTRSSKSTESKLASTSVLNVTFDKDKWSCEFANSSQLDLTNGEGSGYDVESNRNPTTEQQYCCVPCTPGKEVKPKSSVISIDLKKCNSV